MFYQIKLTLGALLLCGGMTLSAQYQRPLHPDDRNGDGAISRDEWRGSDRMFRDYDRNRDGILSGTEVPGSRRNDAVTERDAYDDRVNSRNRTRAGSLDNNASGVVEGYEWPYNADIFHRLDTNEDSVLSTDELNNLNNLTLTQLDTNRNGRIDREEWPGGFAQFERLDANGDGKIGPREYFDRGGEYQRRQRFDNWDANRDGTIQSTEWKSAPRLFHRLDTNGDSMVSWDEFRADTERYSPPYDWK